MSKGDVTMEDITPETVPMEPVVNGYTLFIPNLSDTTNCTLISSTFDRYNDTIKNSLEKDVSIIQQKVNLSLQTNTNNFYRNAKWYWITCRKEKRNPRANRCNLGLPMDLVY
jgi:hypothetical protein